MVTPETTARGPMRVPPIGVSRARQEIAATNRPTEATTATIGTLNRHHGNRFARNVETGTVAATTATVRTTPSRRTRVASDPNLRRHTSRTNA